MKSKSNIIAYDKLSAHNKRMVQLLVQLVRNKDAMMYYFIIRSIELDLAKTYKTLTNEELTLHDLTRFLITYNPDLLTTIDTIVVDLKQKDIL